MARRIESLVMAGPAERLGIYGFGAAGHIVAQIARWQGRSVHAFTRSGDIAAQDFARRLGAAAAPVGAYWGEARIALPEGNYEEAISGRAHRGGTARLSELLAEFPAALLIQGSKKRAA